MHSGHVVPNDQELQVDAHSMQLHKILQIKGSLHTKNKVILPMKGSQGCETLSWHLLRISSRPAQSKNEKNLWNPTKG